MGPGGDGRSRPAPGIEGRNARGGWCALDLVARSRAPAALRDAAAAQPQAERGHGVRVGVRAGMSLALGARRYLFVSGTASIDDHGATVHVGDFEAQTRHTLEAIAALLEGAGASPLRTSGRPRRSSEPLRRPRLRAHRGERGSIGAPGHDRRRRLPRRPARGDRRHRGRAAPPREPGGEPRRRAALASSWLVALRIRAAAAGRAVAARRARRRWSWRRCRAARARRRRSPAARCAARSARAAGSCSWRRGPRARAHRRLPQRGRPRGVLRRERCSSPAKKATDPWCAWEMNADGTGPAADHVRRRRRSASRSTSPPSTRSRRPTSSPGCQIAFVGENPGERNEARRRAEHQPVVVQDRRHRAAAADVQPVERHGPGDPAGRPHGLRGLAAPAGGREPAGPRRAPRRQRGRHRLPDLRRRPGPAREADAGADHGRPRGLRRIGPIRRRRRGPARVGQPGPPAALATARSAASGRPLPRARAAARRPRARRLAARRRAHDLFGVYRFDPATGAREKVFARGRAGTRSRPRPSRPARCPTRARASCATTTPRARCTRSTSASRRPRAERSRRAPRRRCACSRACRRPPIARRPAAPRRGARRGATAPYQVQVPANTPVQLQLLDADGLALRTLRVAVGAQPRRPGLRRLPRGPRAHAAEPPDEGARLAGAPVLNPPHRASGRTASSEARGGARRGGRDARRAGEPRRTRARRRSAVPPGVRPTPPPGGQP